MEVNRVGKIIASLDSGDKEKVRAAAVVNYWRGIRGCPPQCLCAGLEEALDDASGYGIVGRIRKCDTIRGKLIRKSKITNLASMHDVAGRKVVVLNLLIWCDVHDALALAPNMRCLEWYNHHDCVASPKVGGYKGWYLPLYIPVRIAVTLWQLSCGYARNVGVHGWLPRMHTIRSLDSVSNLEKA